MKDSEAPLADGFRAVLGDGPVTAGLTLAALAGLLASFHTVMYAYGRVLFALSRAGYLPRWISVVSRRRTPHRALILGGAAGLACALVMLEASPTVGAALVCMSVASAVISYALVLLSYIVLRISRPDLPRPYRSPLGIPGAAAGMGLSLVVLAACFQVEDYRRGMYGVVMFLALALLYFVFYSRKRLVLQAPEEEAALLERAQAELARDPVR
jgi:ethanolamine permease